MPPRIDISIDELPEASSLLDGHDYSSQIIQRIARVPVILDASGCPHSPFFGSVEKVGVEPDPKRVGPASWNLEYG